MTRRTRAPLCALALLLLVLLGTPSAHAASPDATHIVRLRDGVSRAPGPASARAAHGRVTGAVPLIRGLAARLTPSARTRLARDPRIASVTPNATLRTQAAS